MGAILQMNFKKKGSIGFLAVLIVLTLVLGACAKKEDPNAAANNSANSSTNSGATGESLDYTTFEEAAAAAVKASVDKYEGPTTASKAPQGIKIAMISCASALEGCEAPVTGAKNAAKELGWEVQSYDGGGSAQQQNKSMLNAISWGADIILNVGIDPNLVQQGLKAAKDKGVIVGSGSNAIDDPNPIVETAPGNIGYAFDIAPDYTKLGKALASWFIVETKGEANLAFFSDPEFPAVLAIEKFFLEEVKKVPGIKVSEPIKFTANQIGTTLGQMTTGYLKSHPEVNWIWSAEDPAAAVQVAAIRQAGLADKVKLMSQVGAQQNMNFIRNGEIQMADAAFDNEYMGWAMVDQSIRLLNKEELAKPHNENLPYVIIDKTNLPADGSNWTAPFDYKTEYLGLWK
jgi:ribose transport system substrate-binding protein